MASTQRSTIGTATFARAADPGGQHGDAVVAGEVVAGRVEVGLVAMGAGEPRNGDCRGDQLRTAGEDGEGAYVRPVQSGRVSVQAASPNVGLDALSTATGDLRLARSSPVSGTTSGTIWPT